MQRSEGKISGSVSVKRRFITGNNRSDFTVGTEDGHSDCTDTTGDMAAAQTRTSCNAGVRRELGGDDDIGSINRTIASPGSGRVTLGGGGAIATGSESYGEVYWSCPDPALATKKCRLCFLGQLFTIILQDF